MTKRIAFLVGIGVTLISVSVWAVHLNDSVYFGRILVQGSGTTPTCATASTAVGSICVDQDIEMNDDLDVGDDATIRGDLTVLGTTTLASSPTYADDAKLVFGTGSDVYIEYDNAVQTPDTMVIGLSADSRGLVVMEAADTATDMAHAQQTNPTLFIHSADATDTTQWVSLSHNQTTAVLDSGKGAIAIPDGFFVTDQLLGCFGASSDACFEYDTSNTPDTLVLGVSADSNGFQICEKADMATDFGHALATNPTLWIHSADATDTTQFVGLYHNQTNAVLDTGKGVITFPDGTMVTDDKNVCMGASSDACFQYDTAQTPDALVLGLGADSNGLVIAEKADIDTDFGHGLATNPTLFIHAADQTNTAKYFSATHDGTNAVLSTGTGAISMTPNSGVVSVTGGISTTGVVAAAGAITGLVPVPSATIAYTISAPSQCGSVVMASTDNTVITLPNAAAANAGCVITVVNTSADTGALVSVSPHSSDSIDGQCSIGPVEIDGGADKDLQNTKGSHVKGDSATIVSDGTSAWWVTSCNGIWAHE